MEPTSGSEAELAGDLLAVVGGLGSVVAVSVSGGAGGFGFGPSVRFVRGVVVLFLSVPQRRATPVPALVCVAGLGVVRPAGW